MKHAILAILLVSLAVGSAPAEDWPMYRGNAARDGYTTDQLPAKLSLRWEHKPAHAPAPAWPNLDRMPFDRVYHPVIAGGTVFYGSSADGKVYALDAATGQIRWTVFTDGPVRFAPAAWKDRIFVGSDDGYLYCLSAADGTILWKRRGGPGGRMVLGNDRMISGWPVRGGPVILDDRLYVTAGIWPSEGIYIYALDPDTGKVLWVNDDSGSIEMNQPHGGARAKSGVSGQGHLAAAGNQIFVPTGRAVPAVFNRADGTFQYFHLQKNGHIGGSEVAIIGSYFHNGRHAFDVATGKSTIKVGGTAVAAFADTVILGGKDRVHACLWGQIEKKDRKGNTIKIKALKELWSVEAVPAGTSLIVAGNRIVSGGGKRVCMIDIETKKAVWSREVDGVPYGLAVADGRLYVSTDRGTIYCFDGQGKPATTVAQREADGAPYGQNAINAAAAKAIIKQTGITEGYCLDLGCGDGGLAYELAKRTRLMIYAIDSDARNVAEARKRLDAAGLYGVRVTVHRRDPTRTGYPNYFANLVVSGRSVAQGPGAVPAAELRRLQRPYGGVACIGKPEAMRKTVRGPLAGAGEWTHLYSNAANTSCSTDTLLKGPLTMLWFRDVDLPMPQRHGRGPGPLFCNGRMFAEGISALRATDAYNGRTLWEYPLRNILKAYSADHLIGVAGTGGNFCVADEGLYVRTASRCLRLDPATGEKLGEFATPKGPAGKPGTWGFIACEKGTLFGSLANTDHVVQWSFRKAEMGQLQTESSLFFAMDSRTGDLKWAYKPKHSIRHNAIAIGENRVYLIDRPPAEMDRIEHADARKGKKPAKPLPEHPTGELVALDASTGEILWKTDENIWGTTLTLSTQYKLLLMHYLSTRFKLPSERGGRMAVFDAETGSRMWEHEMKYSTRPVVNDRRIYALGGALDLVTGEAQKFDFDKSYGCGQLAGARNLLVFRSATLGYLDLARSAGTENYGGVRPGCWINAIPAGGIVLLPDAASGCKCSYLMQVSMALQPGE